MSEEQSIYGSGGDGGRGGFSSLARIWEQFDNSSPPARFIFSFFFKVRLTRAHYFHSLGQDQSTVAQRAETTVAEYTLTSCV